MTRVTMRQQAKQYRYILLKTIDIINNTSNIMAEKSDISP